jgi:NADPH:quinone reductase-like Zn-dependent oxidoreductase
VIASVGSPVRGEGLAALGADEVVIGLEGVTAPLHVVLDNVGGPQLAAIWPLLGEHGVIQCIGHTSRQEAAFASLSGMHRSIEAFIMGPRTGEDIAYLVRLMEAGKLDVGVGWRGPWTRIGEAAEALFGRQVKGKVVLDVD